MIRARPCHLPNDKRSAIVAPDVADRDVIRFLDVNATVSCDGKVFARRTFSVPSSAGVSYLHLQTLAEGEDAKGTYFRSFSKE